ncbi:Protein Wnt-7b [Exaiptasia diaphana]|nr:Protein Wnt-7b [Exaiptasia diaphana]
MECKCIGPSKSCNVRTCWKRLAGFRTVGKGLHELYMKSVKVKSNQAQSSLVLVGDPFSKPTAKKEFVHIKDSPNYCDRKASLGILGTHGRTCVRDSNDKEADVCDIMCCGRGYDTRIVMRKWKCRCKFYWCCFVKY